MDELKTDSKLSSTVSLRNVANPEDLEWEISLKEPLTEEPDIEVDEPISLEIKTPDVPNLVTISEDSFSKNLPKPASKYKGFYKKRSKRQKLSSSQEDSGSNLDASALYSRNESAEGKQLRPKSILKKPIFEEDIKWPKTYVALELLFGIYLYKLHYFVLTVFQNFSSKK